LQDYYGEWCPKGDKGGHGSNEGIAVGSLYIMQGTTVTRVVTVGTASADVNETRLWHMRLGHMSEKGMTIYSIGTGKLDFCDHCIFGK